MSFVMMPKSDVMSPPLGLAQVADTSLYNSLS